VTGSILTSLLVESYLHGTAELVGGKFGKVSLKIRRHTGCLKL